MGEAAFLAAGDGFGEQGEPTAEAGREGREMPENWNVERLGSVVVAAHANPPMNYLSATGAAEFSDLIEEWRDPSVRVVVLCGDVPGRFITHYSVEELVELSRDRNALVDAGAGLTDDYHAMLKRLNDLPKPIVCALNGDTMG